MFGIAHLKGRYPRVSYRTEAPFMVAAGITFGLFTYLHHSIYSKCKNFTKVIFLVPAGSPDPFDAPLNANSQQE